MDENSKTISEDLYKIYKNWYRDNLSPKEIPNKKRWGSRLTKQFKLKKDKNGREGTGSGYVQYYGIDIRDKYKKKYLND